MLEELDLPESAPDTLPGEVGDMLDVLIVEDIVTAWFADREELNVVGDCLRRRGWREPVTARRHLEALRDLIRDDEAATVEENLGSQGTVR